MCDPFSMAVGALGATLAGGALRPKAPRGPAPADPEAERMKAEADAAASANRKLAADQARRRQQQSLVARGAPSLGDEQNTGQGVINTGSAVELGISSARRFRSLGYSTSSPQGSLISRGASGAGGGGGRETRSPSKSVAF